MRTTDHRKRWVYAITVAVGVFCCVLADGPANAATPRHSSHHRGHVHYGPWTVSIPRIGVNAPVIELGGPRNGAIAVPSFTQLFDIGWYRYGAVPGHPGNAILLGHVDTYTGPAVFYNLYQLRPNDRIDVQIDGRYHGFRVRWVKEVPKKHFPSAAVFGRTRSRRLWLITCGGTFNYATRSYEDNIIVSAQPT